MLDITRPPFVFPCLVAGEALDRSPRIEVRYPYTGEVVGSAPSLGDDDVIRALRLAAASRSELTRRERGQVLLRAAARIEEVPGYRTEATPFDGIKDSGIGVKEGVVEAMKAMTTTRLYSLPWE